MSTDLRKLSRLISGLQDLLATDPDEEAILRDGGAMLQTLVAEDGWLPDSHAAPDPDGYRQYQLYRDPDARFSVVSFVWGPGQSTPIHDHTVWGLIGMLRGVERNVLYARGDDGGLSVTSEAQLRPGEVDAVSPTVGDIHQVSNALLDAVSISIHVYGADIGQVRRHVFDAETGVPSEFVSGYSEAPSLTIPLDAN